MTSMVFAGTTPLEIHGPGGHVGFLEPLVGLGGFLLVVAMLILGFLLLRRYGLIPDQLIGTRRVSPEDSARTILAERMARGDVSTEEFMERASVLNWTPGSDLIPPAKRTRRR